MEFMDEQERYRHGSLPRDLVVLQLSTTLPLASCIEVPNESIVDSDNDDMVPNSVLAEIAIITLKEGTNSGRQTSESEFGIS